MHAVAASEFRGTARFELRACVGQGAVGVVYDAYDRELRSRVALKTLRTLSPDFLLSLKSEFRSVQGIQHDNLVSLGELFEANGVFFFSMEFVEGEDFLRYVRPWNGAAGIGKQSASRPPRPISSNAPPRKPSPHPSRMPSRSDGEPAVPPVSLMRERLSSHEIQGALDEGRLRAALAQLVRGLAALHNAGKLHRDIKPSNVLVTKDGRVVILDFGVASDLLPFGDADEGGLIGTASYMAPEQAAGEETGPPIDFYAVGVILFQALTGRLPFLGTVPSMLEQKLRCEAPSVSELSPAAPADLALLCTRLLRMEPTERPNATEILAMLGALVDDEAMPSSVRTRTLIGRDDELRILDDAFAATSGAQSTRHAVTVMVRGESGVGKSHLAWAFTQRALERLSGVDLEESADGPLVLAGRCYERESVPYKAVDGVIDDLARHLGRLSVDGETVTAVGRAAKMLSRVFPVLSQIGVETTVGLGMDVLDPADAIVNPQERRQRVFAALRGILTYLAESRPLIVAIDDLQWADADSMALLAEVMRPPNAPPLLLLATTRVVTESGKRARPAMHEIPGDVRLLELGQLGTDHATELITRLLDARGEVSARSGNDPLSQCDAHPTLAEEARAIAVETKGHPLFIDELVRQRIRRGAGAPPMRLDDALWERVQALEPAARSLLEVVALAGVPIHQGTAADAASLTQGQFFFLSSTLRAANLARATGPGRDDLIEPYHDRVRETVVSHLDGDARRACHERLALALERSTSADAESLARHWSEIGNHVRTAEYAEVAADQAAAALAFDRAARLYRLALDARAAAAGASPASRASEDLPVRALKTKLAEALTNAGRRAEAAEVRLELAHDAPPLESLDLRRRAAEQFLCSGHFEKGLVLLRAALTETGERFPRSPIVLIFWLIVARAFFRIRGLGFTSRPASEIDRKALVHVDTLRSAGSGFAMSDNIRGSYFQTRCLLAALRVGEPGRIVHALCMEVCFTSSGGSRTRARADRLLAAAEAMARDLGTPEAHASVLVARGYTDYMNGHFKLAYEALSAGEEILRDKCVGYTFEVQSTRTLLYRAIAFLGDVRGLGRRVPPVLREVVHQGDIHAEINVRTIGLDARVGGRRTGPCAARDRACARALSVERVPRAALLLQHRRGAAWSLRGRACRRPRAYSRGLASARKVASPARADRTRDRHRTARSRGVGRGSRRARAPRARRASRRSGAVRAQDSRRRCVVGGRALRHARSRNRGRARRARRSAHSVRPRRDGVRGGVDAPLRRSGAHPRGRAAGRRGRGWNGRRGQGVDGDRRGREPGARAADLRTREGVVREPRTRISTRGGADPSACAHLTPRAAERRYVATPNSGIAAWSIAQAPCGLETYS